MKGEKRNGFSTTLIELMMTARQKESSPMEVQTSLGVLFYLCACGGMADTMDLGSIEEIRESSSLSRRTINQNSRTCRPTCINSGFYLYVESSF